MENDLSPLRSCLLLWYFHLRRMWGYVGISCLPNTLKSPQILFPKNTLPWWRVFNLAKNTLEWRRFVGISQDYPLKTRTSKQPIGKISGYEIIPSHPLKYRWSKQGLKDSTLLILRLHVVTHVLPGPMDDPAPLTSLPLPPHIPFLSPCLKSFFDAMSMNSPQPGRCTSNLHNPSPDTYTAEASYGLWE
jgi:hypothetical protein